jgi:hypothetical protein
MKLSLCFALFLLPLILFGQTKKAATNKSKMDNKDKPVSDVKKVADVKKQVRPDSIAPFIISSSGDTINRTDDNNLRQGNWILKSGGDFDEPLQTEVGLYIHGKKFGQWKTFEGGSLVRDENYYNNSLDGKSMYFENGILVAIANYYASHRTGESDTIVVVNPITEVEKIMVVKTEGTSYRDGEWRYFSPNSGKLTKLELYAVDQLVFEKDFTIPKMSDSVDVALSEKNIPHYRPYLAEAASNSHIKMDKVQTLQKKTVFTIPQGLGRRR